MTQPSLVIEQLTKRYGAFTALDHLDLKAEGSKCVGFLGPNGAGKTTTLKMATDMIFPTTGRVLLNGISVQAERKKALRDCGVLIESPEVYPSLTPREALKMVGGLRGLSPRDANRRVDEVLAEVKMSDWADKKVGKFSKGMKQRVNIASSLLTDPQILILDEPTTGLDPRGMSEVRTIIRGLKKSNRLIFMSSHILSEVVDVCDEVALLDRGKLLFFDTLANVTARFSAGEAVVDVVFARPLSPADVQGKIVTLPTVAGCEQLDPARLRLRVKGGASGQERLVEELVELHLGLLSLHESASALEEIYLQQIGRGD